MKFLLWNKSSEEQQSFIEQKMVYKKRKHYTTWASSNLIWWRFYKASDSYWQERKADNNLNKMRQIYNSIYSMMKKKFCGHGKTETCLNRLESKPKYHTWNQGQLSYLFVPDAQGNNRQYANENSQSSFYKNFFNHRFSTIPKMLIHFFILQMHYSEYKNDYVGSSLFSIWGRQKSVPFSRHWRKIFRNLLFWG